MCSVMGCFDEKISEEDFINGFERTKSRGPDMSKVENYNGARLGFHRLAIMGLTNEGMPPFNFDNAQMCIRDRAYNVPEVSYVVELKSLSDEYLDVFKEGDNCLLYTSVQLPVVWAVLTAKSRTPQRRFCLSRLALTAQTYVLPQKNSDSAPRRRRATKKVFTPRALSGQ